VSSTKILLPEKSGWNFGLASVTMNDPVTAGEVGILAGHDYGAPAGPVNNYGKPQWETECSLLGGSDSSIGNGVYWAKRIHTFMTSVEANAWHYWWLISGGTGNEGLCDSTWVPAKRMYTLGNYSRFVRPGYYRIGSADNAPTAVLTSAYKDPDSNTFAIVAVNQYDGNLLTTFNLNGFPFVGKVTPWITSASLNLADQPDVAVTNLSFTYELPAMSVVTFVGQALIPTNVALAANGAAAVGSSTYASINYSASGAIDGDRAAVNWGAGGGWNDGTRATFPDTLEVDFPASKLINEIDVYTLQNNWTTAGEPDLSTPATGEGILDFDVQYWNGTAWVTVPNGSVTSNDKAWRQFKFDVVTTTRIRVVVNNARNNYSRIVEVEAYGFPAP